MNCVHRRGGLGLVRCRHIARQPDDSRMGHFAGGRHHASERSSARLLVVLFPAIRARGHHVGIAADPDRLLRGCQGGAARVCADLVCSGLGSSACAGTGPDRKGWQQDDALDTCHQ